MAKKPVVTKSTAKPANPKVKADAPVTMSQMREYVRGYARGMAHAQKLRGR